MRAHRQAGLLGAAFSALVAVSFAGCQAIVDFDEDRICTTSEGQPLLCEDPDVAPPGTETECVVGSCNEDTGGCDYVPDAAAQGAPCLILDPCQLNTTCQGVACVGTPAPDGTECTLRTPTGAPGSFNGCNPGTCMGGVCVTASLDVGDACDDRNACTDGTTCQESIVDGETRIACTGGAPVNDGLECDDGNLCTLFNACVNGTCIGNPVFCDDPANQCDPATGLCPGE